MLEFKQLSFKLVGCDTVTFRLEDGTLVKVRVDLDRAGKALNFKNPDGSDLYNINISNKVSFQYVTGKFFAPRPQATPKTEPNIKPI